MMYAAARPDSRVVVGGAGVAGGAAVAALRDSGFQGPITLISEESVDPYDRPPLSKEWLLRGGEQGYVPLHAPEFYRQHEVEILYGTRLTEINRTERRVYLSTGVALAYDTLVLAMGGTARKLNVPGISLHGITYLRHASDAEFIRDYLSSGARVVVIGGGFIGLEVAAAGRQLGSHVTVIESASRLMARAVTSTVSDAFARLHRQRGVNLMLNSSVAAVEGTNEVEAVLLSDGTRIPADLVVIGIGLAPGDEIARRAGLDVADGVIVDEHCRTADPAIFAIGDLARQLRPTLGRHVRLESWENARLQARTAVDTICGRLAPDEQPPWFWSQQYEYLLQIVGHAPSDAIQIVRGNEEGLDFIEFLIRDGCIVSAQAVGRGAELAVTRRALAHGRPHGTVALMNTDVPLRQHFSEPMSASCNEQRIHAGK